MSIVQLSESISKRKTIENKINAWEHTQLFIALLAPVLKTLGPVV